MQEVQGVCGECRVFRGVGSFFLRFQPTAAVSQGWQIGVASCYKCNTLCGL